MSAPLKLMVRKGASGNTQRTGPTAARFMLRNRGMKSPPVVPRPCSTMRLATGAAAGSRPVTITCAGRVGFNKRSGAFMGPA
ncbi:hypothetical protein D9M68_873420 [compost metagenome]